MRFDSIDHVVIYLFLLQKAFFHNFLVYLHRRAFSSQPDSLSSTKDKIPQNEKSSRLLCQEFIGPESEDELKF